MGRRIDLHCCLVLVLLAFVGHFPSVTSNPLGPPILEKISACDTVSFVKDSTYFSDCGSELYPTKYVGDGLVPQCMVLYDIMYRICTYESKVDIPHPDRKLTLPSTGQEFDANLQKLAPQPSVSNVQALLCESIKSLFDKLKIINIQPVNDVEPYKKYVAESLLDAKECPFTCHTKLNKENKFCMILFWANDLFATVKPLDETPSTTKNLTTNAAAPATVQETARTVGKPAVAGDNVEKKASEQIKSPTSSDAVAKAKASQLPNKEAQKKETVQDNSDKTKQKNDQSDNVNLPNNGNENDENKQKSNIQLVNNEQSQQNVLPSEKKANAGTQDIIEKPMQSNLQSEDENPENISLEDEQNKNINEDGAKDYNGQVGQEMEEKLNEQGKVIPERLDNQDDANPLPQEARKFHSSIGNEENESHFFAYFSLISMCCLLMYIGYHNKQKILAMLLEGRRGRRGGRGSRRRPSTASYRKLDSNLEEAVTSQCSSNVTHVIY